MYYVYVLKSHKDGNYYVGQTADLEKRIKRHKNGLVRSTQFRRPLRLVYQETCKSRSEAIYREKYLKTLEGGSWLKKMLRNLGV